MLRKLFFYLRYFGNPPWDTGHSPPELMEFIQQHPVGCALDLGCGTGTNVITLAQHGWQAMGIDFISSAIQNARRKAKRANIHADFEIGDVTRLDHITGPYDLILDIGCFHSLPNTRRGAYLQGVQRLLAPGGTFLLYSFFQADPQGDDTGITEADLHAIQNHLEFVARQDGSERGLRASTWLTYMKPR